MSKFLHGKCISLSLHSGIEFGRSRTEIGVCGGAEEGGGVRSKPEAARTILRFHALVLGPLNSLKTSLSNGWRIHVGVEVAELRTNKQHTLSIEGGNKTTHPPTPRFFLISVHGEKFKNTSLFSTYDTFFSFLLKNTNSSTSNSYWLKGEGKCGAAHLTL